MRTKRHFKNTLGALVAGPSKQRVVQHVHKFNDHMFSYQSDQSSPISPYPNSKFRATVATIPVSRLPREDLSLKNSVSNRGLSFFFFSQNESISTRLRQPSTGLLG